MTEEKVISIEEIFKEIKDSTPIDKIDAFNVGVKDLNKCFKVYIKYGKKEGKIIQWEEVYYPVEKKLFESIIKICKCNANDLYYDGSLAFKFYKIYKDIKEINNEIKKYPISFDDNIKWKSLYDILPHDIVYIQYHEEKAWGNIYKVGILSEENRDSFGKLDRDCYLYIIDEIKIRFGIIEVPINKKSTFSLKLDYDHYLLLVNSHINEYGNDDITTEYYDKIVEITEELFKRSL